jgi:predicted nucleotidyltransferase
MTSRRERSLAAIATVARALGEERRRVVFVGGTVVALYPLEGGADVRPTVDVDCIVDVTTLDAYYAFVERLRSLGFEACTDEGAPLCRLVVSGIRVDVMGAADLALGPTNRWYAEAIAAAEARTVAPGLEVLAITPVYFAATKLAAFHSRGRGDYVESHDLEDVLTVLAGLPSLRAEVAAAGSGVARAVRDDLVALATREAFLEATWGHFEGDAAGQRRAAATVAWLRGLGRLVDAR